MKIKYIIFYFAIMSQFKLNESVFIKLNESVFKIFRTEIQNSISRLIWKTLPQYKKDIFGYDEKNFIKARSDYLEYIDAKKEFLRLDKLRSNKGIINNYWVFDSIEIRDAYLLFCKKEKSIFKDNSKNVKNYIIHSPFVPSMLKVKRIHDYKREKQAYDAVEDLKHMNSNYFNK